MKKLEPLCIIDGNVKWFNQHKKNSLGLLKKLPYGPAIPHPSITQSSNLNKYVFIHVLRELSTMTNKWKQPKCSSTDDLDTQNVTYHYSGILLSPRKE
jgi:hypothetical protein